MIETTLFMLAQLIVIAYISLDRRAHGKIEWFIIPMILLEALNILLLAQYDTLICGVVLFIHNMVMMTVIILHCNVKTLNSYGYSPYFKCLLGYSTSYIVGVIAVVWLAYPYAETLLGYTH